MMSAASNLEVPDAVASFLQKNRQSAMCVVDGSTGYACASARASVYLWKCTDGPLAEAHEQKLPYALSGRPVISICASKVSGDAAVLLCTHDGNITLWPSFSSTDETPLQARVPESITAATMALDAWNAAILAVVSTANSDLYVLRGTYSEGGESGQPPLRLTVEKLGTAELAQQPSGVFGKLGSFWRPQQQQRGGSSSAAGPAQSLHLRQGNSASATLLALHTNAIDCWKVSYSASGPPAELQWSLPLSELLSGAGSPKTATLNAVCWDSEAGEGAVLASVPRGQAGQPELCSVGLRQTAQAVMWKDDLQPIKGVPGCTDPNQLRYECVGDEAGVQVLAWEAGGRAWSGSSQTEGRELHLQDGCLNSAAAPDRQSWLLLTPKEVLSVPWLQAQSPRHSSDDEIVDAPEEVPRLSQQDPDSLSGEPGPGSEAAFRLLDAACQGRGVSALAAELGRVGGLAGRAGQLSVAALFSTRLVDTLPKHWGSSGSAAVAEQLEEKLSAHNVLLQTLGDAGVLTAMDAPSLRVVFENGEKLAAVASVREAENRALGGVAGPAGQPLPIQLAIRIAGEQCAPRVAAGIQSREAWDVFYACPSATAPALFGVLAGLAGQLDGAPSTALAQMDTLAQLAKAAQGALAAAGQQRGWQQHWFPSAVSLALGGVAAAEWLAGPQVRAALGELSAAAIRLLPVLHADLPQRAAECRELLAELADRLLDAFAGAVAAAEPGEAAAALQAQYATARQRNLQVLLEEAVAACRQDVATGESLLQRVESLAEAHGGYPQLFDICEFIGDRERLYSHMAALSGSGRGAAGSAAVYVFERLMRDGRSAELLELPEAFDPELEAWLREGSPGGAPLEARLPIRWLHELRMGKYGEAAGTLLEVSDAEQTLERRSRLACLAKLAGLAEQPDGVEQLEAPLARHLEACDGRLALAHLQEDLELGLAAPRSPRSLVDAALSEGAAARQALLAFNIAAAAGHDFRQRHSAMLDAAWKRVALATDWGDVAEQRGMLPDDAYVALLEEQPVTEAAKRCYSSAGLMPCMGGSFAEAYPPEQAAAVLQELELDGPSSATSFLLAAFERGCLAGEDAGGAEAMEVME